MYMAYGWPQVIAIEPGSCPAALSDRLLYIKTAKSLLLVVAPTHLELWSASQHKVRLGKYARDLDSVQREGENLQAVWSPDTKTIAVLAVMDSDRCLCMVIPTIKRRDLGITRRS